MNLGVPFAPSLRMRSQTLGLCLLAGTLWSGLFAPSAAEAIPYASHRVVAGWLASNGGAKQWKVKLLGWGGGQAEYLADGGGKRKLLEVDYRSGDVKAKRIDLKSMTAATLRAQLGYRHITSTEVLLHVRDYVGWSIAPDVIIKAIQRLSKKELRSIRSQLDAEVARGEKVDREGTWKKVAAALKAL